MRSEPVYRLVELAVAGVMQDPQAVESDHIVVKEGPADLLGWVLGVDVNGDPPLARVNVILGICHNVTGVVDPIGDFLYRSGRQLRSAQRSFPVEAPYKIEEGESVVLFIRAGNYLRLDQMTFRGNVIADFLEPD